MAVRQHTRPLRAVWAPSRLRRAVRRRGVWAVTAVVCVVAAGIAVEQRIGALERERSSWGETRSVVVVVEPIAVGEPLSASVVMRLVPAAMVPPDALGAFSRDDLARVDLYTGEIVLSGRVTGSGRHPFPDGTVAITMAIASRAPLVSAGDLVDLWMIDSANLSSRRVAERVVVLARSDDDLTVAVPEAQIAQTTAAALRPVTVVLVG